MVFRVHSIVETTMKESTILPHILGCLAGSMTRQSWSISEQNRDNCIPPDRFTKYDPHLASSLLECLLLEFTWLGICCGKFDKDKITFSPQPKMINDPIGHQWMPTCSTGSTCIFHFGSFSIFFQVPNLWGHFEALNDFFFMWKHLIDACWHVLGSLECVLFWYTFLTRYQAPQMKIICKSYTLGKLTYQLP
jgi:hypothetical protein